MSDDPLMPDRIVYDPSGRRWTVAARGVRGGEGFVMLVDKLGDVALLPLETARSIYSETRPVRGKGGGAMTPIEAARREWPALEWVPDGFDLNGSANGCIVVQSWPLRGLGEWMVHLPDHGTMHVAPTLTAALRAARYALPEHVEHVPRTPMEVARHDWPALRWTCERDRYGGWCLRGHAGRSVVAMATRWPGRGWLVSGEDGVPVRARSLRAGLRALRWSLP